MRRKILFLGLACLTVSGCQTANETNGAVGGGIIGGIIGTGVGILTHRPAAGLAIGAGTGALVGTAVGANKDTQDAKAAKAYAESHPPLQLTDIVQMANSGVADSLIIRQMDVTNSYYRLSAADIEYLTQAAC